MNSDAHPAPGGLEQDDLPQHTSSGGLLFSADRSWKLIQVSFQDRTDLHDSLLHEREYLLLPRCPLQLSGNLFVLEDSLSGEGELFLLPQPLPASRPQPRDWDFEVIPDSTQGYRLRSAGNGNFEDWQRLSYSGGRLGRTRVLQLWQRAQRPDTDSHRIPRSLSNTWGDRSRDSRMNEAFMLGEIQVAAELGIDVVQLDDGWQKGMTSNSAEAAGAGAWSGFWDSDPEFWTPHPQRFPRGLQPLLEEARLQGLELGLWFAPDSSRDFAHWQEDADCLLGLYEEHGIRHFKLDSIDAQSEQAFRHLQAFAQRLEHGSAGKIVCDLDITGNAPRPGYWGMLSCGPLFLENRYSDWGNYQPLHTLRNLWQLSHWVDPQRLRMEWLNPLRNRSVYGEHPLAPRAWPIETLVAMTLPALPLAWCELQHLDPDLRQRIAPLLSLWKEHREPWADGTILPLGQAPDGRALSAFASISDDGHLDQLFAFRGLARGTARIPLPEEISSANRFKCLAGDGHIEVSESGLQLHIETPLGFAWFKAELAPA